MPLINDVFDFADNAGITIDQEKVRQIRIGYKITSLGRICIFTIETLPNVVVFPDGLQGVDTVLTLDGTQ